MDKLLIISNVRCKELGSFIRQRGTFDVIGCYDSISTNLVDIQSKILEVEKTLYLYQPDDTALNIRTDMQVFRNLISGGGFFKPGEIVFITRSTAECKKAEKYFVSVMNSCSYESYTIKEIDETISFSNVYDSLMGITAVNNFRNSYKTFYRAERNSEDSVTYEGQDDSDLMLEPFNFQNLKDYEGQKELLGNLSTGIEFKDDAEGMKTRQIPNVSLGAMGFHDVMAGPQSIMLSGKSKSGLSTWTAALAVSAAKAGKKVLVLDYTYNNDVSVHLASAKINYVEFRMKDILQNSYELNGLAVCTCRNETEFDVRLNFLKHVYCRKAELTFDLVLIPVDSRDFAVAFSMLRGEIGKVILTVVPRNSDVLELLEYAAMLDGTEVVAVMNESVRESSYDMAMSQEKIKETLSVINAKVVSSVWFGTLDVGRNISEAII